MYTHCDPSVMSLTVTSKHTPEVQNWMICKYRHKHTCMHVCMHVCPYVRGAEVDDPHVQPSLVKSIESSPIESSPIESRQKWVLCRRHRHRGRPRPRDAITMVMSGHCPAVSIGSSSGHIEQSPSRLILKRQWAVGCSPGIWSRTASTTAPCPSRAGSSNSTCYEAEGIPAAQRLTSPSTSPSPSAHMTTWTATLKSSPKKASVCT